jgi:biopolymer transport protein ExbD
MTTTISLNANELNINLLKSLKTMFKDREITLTVDVKDDETDYLNRSEANRLALEKSIAQLRNGRLKTVTIEDLR